MNRAPNRAWVIAWPFERIGEAITALARRGGLDPLPKDLPVPPHLPSQAHGDWIEASAQILGIEAERVETPYAELESYIASSRIVLIPVAHSEGTRYLLMVRSGGVVLGADRELHTLPISEIRAAICAESEAEPLERIEAFLESVGIEQKARVAARRAMLAEQLGAMKISSWMLRLPIEAPFRRLAASGGQGPRLMKALGAHAAFLAIYLLSWVVIGQAALQGRLDRGWLWAWILLLMTLPPIRMAAIRMQARVAVTLGSWLRQRLMAGALQLDPESVLAEGAGQLLGRAIESDSLETLVLSGGFTGVIALMELSAAAAVLIASGAWGLTALLAAWCAVCALICMRYLKRARRWTSLRLDMTHSLVERMVGHRTRLAQERPEQRHEDEDQELDRYLDSSIIRDRAEAALLSAIPQGWLIAGLLAMAPAFLAAQGNVTPLAVGIGGIFLAQRAFKRLSAAAWQMVDARIAWEQLTPLMAEIGPSLKGSPVFAVATSASRDEVPLEAQELVFRYPTRDEPVLRRCSLRISAGERVLMGGSSGGGKSTFVSLLTGIRQSSAGLLLAGGLDRHTLGADGWRRRIVAAPQFHLNHVITGPLFFNLLMGRRGAIGEAEMQEALEICREMGLGDLLERMPGGLFQMVGETGWQLSQGERSRVFIARALLQDASLVVLDESLAALDPETMQRALDCVLSRAKTLLVIAHP